MIITIEVNDETYEQLTKDAERERRTVENEAGLRLERALKPIALNSPSKLSDLQKMVIMNTPLGSKHSPSQQLVDCVSTTSIDRLKDVLSVRHDD